jgi:dTDP-glucose 4,6-dehydratase
MFVSQYSENYTIVVFDNLEYAASIRNLSFLSNYKSRAYFVKGDIANEEQVTACLQKYKIDTIFHLAAQTHVDRSFTAGYSFTRANVLGTQTLLEASSRVATVKRFYHMSTDEVYGELPPFADVNVESDRLAPTNPYSATKAAAEMLVQAYSKTSKLQTVILRPNNIFGPCQYPESKYIYNGAVLSREETNAGAEIIPKFSLLLKRGQKMTLHQGSEMNSRCYLYVTDAVNAINVIFHRGEDTGIYNISSTDEVTNGKICQALVEMLTAGLHNDSVRDWVEDMPDRPYHDRAYGVDGSKLSNLGYKQEVDFESGLRATVGWYVMFGEDWWKDANDERLFF